jgi:hypothetical protein
MKNKTDSRDSKIDFVYQGEIGGVSVGTWFCIALAIIMIFAIPLLTGR